jgi:acetylornithine deacetylase
MSTEDVFRAIERLAQLVAFDTTSRNSNLPLIDWVEDFVTGLGASCVRHPSPCGTKANLQATFGPMVEGGIVLSGHTDVVPVDGQPWSTDPWTLVERDGRLFGRGTCDMKGFSACALALAPKMAAGGLKRPIHLALSYDEEIGCVGAPSMVEAMARDLPAIEAVFVGEPTDMKVVSGQKGLGTFLVEVEGREAHSSQVNQGVSAILEAAPLIAELAAMAADARAEAALLDSPFDPPGTTINLGTIEAGTAVNIIARRCAIMFDIRNEAGDDPQRWLDRLQAKVDAVEARLRARAPEAFARLSRRSTTYGLDPQPDSPAERLARLFTGDNAMRTVAFGTEGGLFQRAGLPTVIVGPGSIAQAHQPDEYIERSQIAACVDFLDRLVAHQSA